jgi:hypothetical protein
VRETSGIVENWNPTVIYQVATARHNDIIARGEAAQQLTSNTRAYSVPMRLTYILAMLLTRRPEQSAPATHPTSEATASPAL